MKLIPITRHVWKDKTSAFSVGKRWRNIYRHEENETLTRNAENYWDLLDTCLGPEVRCWCVRNLLFQQGRCHVPNSCAIFLGAHPVLDSETFLTSTVSGPDCPGRSKYLCFQTCPAALEGLKTIIREAVLAVPHEEIQKAIYIIPVFSGE